MPTCLDAAFDHRIAHGPAPATCLSSGDPGHHCPRRSSRQRWPHRGGEELESALAMPQSASSSTALSALHSRFSGLRSSEAHRHRATLTNSLSRRPARLNCPRGAASHDVQTISGGFSLRWSLARPQLTKDLRDSCPRGLDCLRYGRRSLLCEKRAGVCY